MSGGVGINQVLADKFFADIAGFAAWYNQSEIDPAILPLKNDTQTAANALQAVKEKITDYFTRCQMAEYDARASLPLSRSTEDYQRVATHNLSAASEELAGFPLAGIAANKPLPLTSGINPAWQEKIAALRKHVIQPLLGEQENLSAQQLTSLCDKFKAFEAWQVASSGLSVAGLGIARIREPLAGSSQADITALIQHDLAVENEIKAIRSVEQLLRYKRDLYKLACNFVSFRDFYSGKQKAVFQMGTLYLDGRSCETPENIAEFMSMPEIDGALVGGASLKPDFVDLVRRAADSLP